MQTVHQFPPHRPIHRTAAGVFAVNAIRRHAEPFERRNLQAQVLIIG